MAEHDKLFILNDDNWMDWGILDVLYDYISDDIGVIGMAGNAIDLSGNKVFEQIESVVGRFNEELQAANEEWYQTCEELSTEIKELKARIETKEEMLLILATVLAILISSYSCVVYVHYISMGFKKV